MNLQSLKQEHQAINAELRELNGKLQMYAQESRKFVLPVLANQSYLKLQAQNEALIVRHDKNMNDLRTALETMEPTAASEFLKSFT